MFRQRALLWESVHRLASEMGTEHSHRLEKGHLVGSLTRRMAGNDNSNNGYRLRAYSILGSAAFIPKHVQMLPQLADEKAKTKQYP